MSEEKFERGLACLLQLNPGVEDSLQELDEALVPGLSRIIVEYEFCDIYTRPGLDLKTRQLVTVASLVSLGYAAPQLRVHIGLALNVGSSEREILEVILQTAPFVGFPAVINALRIAREVFGTAVEQQ